MEGQHASQYPQYSVNACEKTFLQDLFSSNSLERRKELSKEESPKEPVANEHASQYCYCGVIACKSGLLIEFQQQ